MPPPCPFLSRTSARKIHCEKLGMKTIIQKLRSDLIDELRKQVFRNRTIVSGKYTEAEGHTGGNKTIL